MHSHVPPSGSDGKCVEWQLDLAGLPTCSWRSVFCTIELFLKFFLILIPAQEVTSSLTDRARDQRWPNHQRLGGDMATCDCSAPDSTWEKMFSRLNGVSITSYTLTDCETLWISLAFGQLSCYSRFLIILGPLETGDTATKWVCWMG